METDVHKLQKKKKNGTNLCKLQKIVAKYSDENLSNLVQVNFTLLTPEKNISAFFTVFLTSVVIQDQKLKVKLQLFWKTISCSINSSIDGSQRMWETLNGIVT